MCEHNEISSRIQDKSLQHSPISGIVVGYFSCMRLSEVLMNSLESKLYLFNRYGDIIGTNDIDMEMTPLQISRADHPSLSGLFEPKNMAPTSEAHSFRVVRKVFFNPFGLGDTGDALQERHSEKREKGVALYSIHESSHEVIQNFQTQKPGFDYQGNHWLLLAETPIEKLRKEARTVAIQNALLTSGVTVIFFIFASVLLTNQISEPIRHIRTALSNLTRGKYQTRIQSPGNASSEILEVSQDINRLTDELEIGKQRTEQAHRLQRIVDHSVSGYMTCDTGKRITYFNRALKKIWG